MDAARILEAEGQEQALEQVHTDALRYFPEVVAELGGDPAALLARAGLDLSLFSERKPRLGFRALASLMEITAAELQRPDFGMLLATRQGGGKVFGAIGVVMRHSLTLAESLSYVEHHMHAYTLAASLRLEPMADADTLFVAMDFLIDRLPDKRQVIEQALLLAQLNAVEITGGRARVRAAHFRHAPLSPIKTYRAYFGCDVLFDQPADGVVFSQADLDCPIADPDEQIYEMATSFIDNHYHRASPPMHARVRGLILQYLGTADCNNDSIAGKLCLHPRTLHRRLKAEGKSFEAIKDEVRRDVALTCLRNTDLPLTRIAEKLGYAETSVLSRSCLRWTGVSPRQIRIQSRLRQEADTLSTQSMEQTPECAE